MSKFTHWGYGLVGGVIGGGATAGLSAIGVGGASLVNKSIPPLDLKQIGIVFLSGAIISALAYLARSPLPPLDDDPPAVNPPTTPPPNP